MAKATGTRRAAKSDVAGRALLVLAFVLILVPVLLAAGCSDSEATTTTTTVRTTTTRAETSTTETTEELVTTTTLASFPPLVTHEQDQTRFSYSGKWRTLAEKSASGKSLAIGNSSSSQLTIRFYGDGISWVAKTSPAYGQASVKVDDGEAQVIDLYSAKTAWKKKVWKSGGLELGDHTVTISWTGKKNKDATATNINIDAIVVSGVLIDRYEQDNDKLTFAGTWKSTKSSSAFGGGFKQADAEGAKVTIRFNGVRLTWLGRTGTGYGQAKVTVDGGPETTVDLYNGTAKSKQEIWSTGVLPLKNHTVTIEWTGTRNDDSVGTVINVDAIEVTGSLK